LAFADLADLQAEAAQQPTQAEFDIPHLGLQQLASHEQRSHLLGRRRLAVDGSEPAHAQELGDAARIAAVGLDDHGRECRLHMPGLQEHDLEPSFLQASMQPLRQRAGLQANAGERQVQAGEKGGEHLRLTGDFGLADNLSRRIKDANAAEFQ
jgi:hypothetical protein